MIADDFPLYRYRGHVLSVTDGDTFVAEISCGFRVTVAIEVRLLGINAPEMHKPTLAEGIAAKWYLASLVEGKQLYLRTEKDHRSFTRYLGNCWTEEDGVLVSVEDRMVASGHAGVYAP